MTTTATTLAQQLRDRVGLITTWRQISETMDLVEQAAARIEELEAALREARKTLVVYDREFVWPHARIGIERIDAALRDC